MFIIIKEKNKSFRYLLDKSSSIFYKGIHIYSKNNNYYIELKDHYYFDDDIKIRKLDYCSYIIKSDLNFYEIKVYVYKNNEGIDDYRLYRNKNIIIAYSKKADIINYDPYYKDYYLIIKDGYLDSNTDIYVNNNLYKKDILKNEDIIQYGGIRIIYYEEFLYINNFNCQNNIEEYSYKSYKIKYPIEKIKKKYYLSKTVKKFKLDELDEFIYQENKNSLKDLLRTLLPNMVMAISMSFIASINYYSNQRDSYASMIYIIMPTGMIISSIIIPLSFYIFDYYVSRNKLNKQINDYIQYLGNYHKKLISRIDGYIEELDSSYFYLSDAYNKMFYALKNSDDYLKISLGKRIINIPFDCSKTGIKIIDDKLEDIRNYLSYIDNIPIYLDLNKYRVITVVSKDRLYFYNKFLLELLFKHNYKDIYVAIYSKDESLFKDIYNIPHLFIDKQRLLLTSKKDLSRLDQLSLDRPLILFMLNNSDYEFTNNNIHLLYFTDDISDLYNNYDVIVDYRSSRAVLYEKQNVDFSYYIEEIDFRSHYHYLGKLFNDNKTNDYSFIDIFSSYDLIQAYTGKQSGLKADFAYCDNELLSFDLHENRQGPHGLIGGSTGSGKSELIISLLLSLCIRYSPLYLNIILIDFKGGGIYDSLKSNDRIMPHIIASISNLEDGAIDRLIIALNNECIKRQQCFKKLSDYCKVSIMNIDDYLNNDYQKYDLPVISHLLIVVDEFAQLKKDYPMHIKDLISISRIGRSLGIHLILSTQKPAGNIDDEIWSNSRFKISLKVNEQKDSLDLLRVKDACQLIEKGEFLLRVDDYISKARSIYSKNDIDRNDPYEVSVMDLSLTKINKKRIFHHKPVSEVSYYVDRIYDVTSKLNMFPDKLNFVSNKPIDRSDITIKNKFIFGQIDDYINEINDYLMYEINDNLLIYSLRENEICSILNTLNENKRQSIIISDNSYEGSYISDCINYGNKNDIYYLFDKLTKDNINISIIIENVYVFLTYDDCYLDRLCRILKRSQNMNYNFIILSNNVSVSYQLISIIKNKIMIEILNITDLNMFLGCNSEYKGRSYYYDGKAITFIPIKIEKYKQEKRLIDNYIKTIPDVIIPDIKDDNILVGYDIENRKEVYIDKDIIVISYSQQLLNRYKKYYENIDIHLYNHQLIKELYDTYLWVGSNIFNQRLFTYAGNKDLSNNQAILIKNNKQTLIRIIDDV